MPPTHLGHIMQAAHHQYAEAAPTHPPAAPPTHVGGSTTQGAADGMKADDMRQVRATVSSSRHHRASHSSSTTRRSSGRSTPPSDLLLMMHGHGHSGAFHSSASATPARSTASSTASSNPISIAGTPTPQTRHIRGSGGALATSGGSSANAAAYLMVPGSLHQASGSAMSDGDSSDTEVDPCALAHDDPRSQSASPPRVADNPTTRTQHQHHPPLMLPEVALPTTIRTARYQKPKRDFSSEYKLEQEEEEGEASSLPHQQQVIPPTDRDGDERMGQSFDLMVAQPAEPHHQADAESGLLRPIERARSGEHQGESREPEADEPDADRVDELTNAHIQRKKRRLGFSVFIDPNDDPDNHVLRHLTLSSAHGALPARDKSKRLALLLADHPLFRTLSPEITRRVHAEFIPESRVHHQVVFRAGDHSDVFYLIQDGEIECVYQEAGVETRMVKGIGATLGDLALMQPSTSPQTFTARIVSATAALYAIDGCIFRYIVQNGMQLRYAQLKSFFQSLPIFAPPPTTTTTNASNHNPTGLTPASGAVWRASPQHTAEVIENLIEHAHILSFHENDVILPGLAQQQQHRQMQQQHQQQQQHSLPEDPPSSGTSTACVHMPMRRLSMTRAATTSSSGWEGLSSSVPRGGSGAVGVGACHSAPMQPRMLSRSSSARSFAMLRQSSSAAAAAADVAAIVASRTLLPQRYAVAAAANAAEPFRATSVFLVKDGVVSISCQQHDAAGGGGNTSGSGSSGSTPVMGDDTPPPRLVGEGELFGLEILSCAHRLLESTQPAAAAASSSRDAAYSPLSGYSPVGSSTPVACASPSGSRSKVSTARKRSRRASITGAEESGEEESHCSSNYTSGSGTTTGTGSMTLLFGASSPILSPSVGGGSGGGATRSIAFSPSLDSLAGDMPSPATDMMQLSASPIDLHLADDMQLCASPPPLTSSKAAPLPTSAVDASLCDCRGEVRCHSTAALIVAVDARVWKNVLLASI